MTRGRVLYVVVCGAGPAGEIGKLVDLAQADGWDVHLIATPAGRDFLDITALEALTGHAVRSAYRDPGQPRLRTPPADAIIVAPATYNTMCKLAYGIADNYALGVLAECIGIGVPVTVLPFINSALAGRRPLVAAVTVLREEGVRVLLGPDGFEPHPPGHGGDRIASFPWSQALTEAAAMAG
jgi:phosphopantothenoylcysteine synthetase/decarboxylase